MLPHGYVGHWLSTCLPAVLIRPIPRAPLIVGIADSTVAQVGHSNFFNFTIGAVLGSEPLLGEASHDCGFVNDWTRVQIRIDIICLVIFLAVGTVSTATRLQSAQIVRDHCTYAIHVINMVACPSSHNQVCIYLAIICSI